MSESEIQQRIQIEAAKIGCVLMRNNSGAMRDETGRVVRYGLGNTSPKQETKSSDLIGITMVTITPEMVGRTIGVFTAIEVKKEEWNARKKLDAHEKYQANFLTWIRMKGGIAGFANSVESFNDLVRKFLNAAV